MIEDNIKKAICKGVYVFESNGCQNLCGGLFPH